MSYRSYEKREDERVIQPVACFLGLVAEIDSAGQLAHPLEVRKGVPLRPVLGSQLGLVLEVICADRAGFLDGVGHVSQIVECHHVAGDDDFLLKVHVAGTRGLEAFVTDGVKSLPGVARTRTTVVLSTQLTRPLAPSPAETPSQ